MGAAERDARSTSSATSRRCCWKTRTCEVLTPDEIEKAFDLDEHFRNVDAIFDRVFASVPAGSKVPSGFRRKNQENMKARIRH